MIPYGRQDIDASDIAAVTSVLKSDFLTQGPQVPAFEAVIAEKTGAAHAIAVNSATSALHIAYLALGLGQGDDLWTSPITFVATANAALYCGANVRFIDIDRDRYTIDLDRLEEALIEAEANGTLPKIVAPVHLAGQSCDMIRLAALGKKYGFAIVEDASHSIGATFDGQPVGDCRYSDICVFSFHPVKIITTAEGGVATTNNPELARQMSLLRSHGITRDADLMTTNDGGWYYEQITLGFNYRMTELQAALGVSQSRRLDQFIDARHERARRYDTELGGLPLRLPFQALNQRSALHLYPVLVTDDAPVSRGELFELLRNAGIGVNLHYIPVYRQPWYRHRPGAGGERDAFPAAEDYYARAISIPLFSGLTETDQDFVVQTLRKALSPT
ncbi:UDP-4-amino-4,6-dideoxy-N-acetyl-beta-L-altrosamine transaminase [Palleronia caenipelagi]|uniref:UDP-4-amino-4, 6-dideoxy-N-acetyl-beta-L-altrosamine transaminase n=1 Tax=Palleronia caenipelagi TaxID=2489174 RepID=A0A547PLE0_9RHOB|nr:UDP-4-amino-4,6-dideoxy-N-acetyl-beta-L-altrosamine transaminase [Palleronia caenipelagi]TRD14951.1 UDP-4-amino-4,6-dideoxy-N-acetyl-beta-L-altrosamine transaminase [Palleronia caenipelagi]